MNLGHKAYLLWAATVVFGAIVHAASQLKVSRDKKVDFTRLDFGILFLIASFSGLVFGLLVMMRTTDIIQIILASAIGAFLGMAGLVKIANIMLDFIALRFGNLPSEKPKDDQSN